MDPNQPNNPPRVPPRPEAVPRPQAMPNQAAPQPGMQPPVPQQPFGQPAYTGMPQQPMQNQYNNSYPTPGNSKKKLLFILIPVVIVVIALVAFLVFGGAKQIVNKVAGIELENYSNQNFGFSIQVPKGWTPKENDEEFLKDVSFQEPVGDVKDQSEANKHYASILIIYSLADREYLEKDEQEYFDGVKKSLQRLTSEKKEKAVPEYVPESSVVETEEMTTVDGLNAYKVKLKVTNFDGVKDSVGYEYLLFVYEDKKNQYELSLRAHESEDINSKADSVLTSFAKN